MLRTDEREEVQRARYEGATTALAQVRELVASGWSYERAVSTLEGNLQKTIEHLPGVNGKGVS
jgi:hypothetical protein